ncbi:synaptosomal-associated protein, 23kDa [Tremella mesenterica]|uniref:Synaptosomal-associated protein, 23kDa n=1 Tax=Tremella mesenterica TaxID=5217 RepID=A0A4Q1BN34_TREME|nr:synaptosomal-associated protein, 23kDa [Tremella mesenterica]
MSFFRRNRNDPVIPPVAPTASQAADPYARNSGSPANQQYGGGDPYGNSRSDPYASRVNGGSNPYAKAGGQDDAARSELFAGYKKPDKPVAERKYGYEGREAEEDFDEDEEVEGIKQEMRGIKQESLASTRNALRLAREAEDTARGTIGKLADQSERIANSERYLDMAKTNNLRAEDKANELRQLNKSIFKPVIVWNKDGKRAAEEQKIAQRYDEARDARNTTLNDITRTRQVLGKAANPGPAGSARQPLAGEQKARKQERQRFQFEATGSDDELEDELDENINETLQVTQRLKQLAVAMGEEVAGQNSRLTRVTDKTENLEFAVMKNTEKLKRIK